MTLCPGTWLTVVLERQCAGDGAGVLVESPEQRFVVDRVPESVLHLLETDHLAVECLREELLSVVESERAGRADATDLEVTGTARRDDARREWSG